MPTNVIDSELKKKIIKSSIKAKVKRHFNLYEYKYNFILSCIEYVLFYRLERIRINHIFKNKNKLKHGRVKKYKSKRKRKDSGNGKKTK